MADAPTIHTTMAELLEGWPSARAVLARRGMACVGCAMARFERISDAAVAYGFEPDDLIAAVIASRRSGGRRRGSLPRPDRPPAAHSSTR